MLFQQSLIHMKSYYFYDIHQTKYFKFNRNNLKICAKDVL